jgi:Glycosyltransferase
MRIAVVDVAAENGGALSILNDFVDYLARFNNYEYEWFIITSVADVVEAPGINVIKVPGIKKSWFHRLIWDRQKFKKLEKRFCFDLVISLQNAAVCTYKAKQIVYFHNALLIESSKRYHLSKEGERKYALYTKLIGPYTLHTLKKANLVVLQSKTMESKLKARVPKLKTTVISPNIEPIKIGSVINGKRIFKGFIYPATPVIFKSHEKIVEAIKLSGIQNIEVIFTFKGNENSYASSILRMCDGDKRFKFYGYMSRDEVLSKFINYGLITASYLESYPIIFIEAMKMNSYIVAPEYDYAKEILGVYENKTMYNPDNANSLAMVIEKSHKAWENIVIRENESVQEGNCWNQMISAMEFVIKDSTFDINEVC